MTKNPDFFILLRTSGLETVATPKRIEKILKTRSKK